MAQPPNISLLYGPTGSPALQSRFSIEGQPYSAIPLMVGGTTSNAPAHLLGLNGSAYRYGPTVVNGSKNMMPIGSSLVSLPPFATNHGAASFDLGKVAGTNSPFHVPLQTYNARYPYMNPVTLMADGEVIGNGVPGSTEAFTTAGTVAITSGNATVVGTGTAWTTNVLTFSYGYTAALNKILPGDILQITHATSGTVYYRIRTVVDDTHLTVFPTPAEASGSSIAYSILRSGYGSYSRVLTLGANPTNYYAGMMFSRSAYPTYSGDRPTIMAYDTTLSPTHRMGPTGVFASDIAYYKSYLVYGYGSTVGWSVPGFPTVSPFAAADFPATSITVVSTQNADSFVSFEYLGDQLIAIFTRSMWIVQQNPGQLQANAFSFYRLPEVIGSIVPLGNGVTSIDPTPQINFGSWFRPTCSADGAIYYLSIQGLMEFRGTLSTHVSQDIDDVLPHGANLHYDPVSDSIIVEQFADPMFIYTRSTQSWSTATWANDFAPFDNWSSRRSVPRMLRWTHYDGTNILGTLIDQTTSNFDRPYASPTDAWSWSSAVANVSDDYPDFSPTGIRIDCEAPGLSTATLTWTLYGGASPYSMNVRKTGSFDAAIGTPNSRGMIHQKIDDPFVAVVLTGLTRIKLIGVWLYQADQKARK